MRVTSKPYFLVTIDTEGDNLWSAPREITTRNSRFLHRFQQTCEMYGVRPTYLTNWEMVQCQVFREFATDVLRRGTGEIGMHLHAWNNPPIVPLTNDDFGCLPFLVEYPDAVMREKIHVLTSTLELTFQTRMVSHRAGRWNIDRRYAAMLIEAGYAVDCSVTPRVSWASYAGDPAGRGGADYRGFPDEPYWIDPSDISRPGRSPLLEVPMTILEEPEQVWDRAKARVKALAAQAVGRPDRAAPSSPALAWLRPNGRNRRQLLRTLSRVWSEGRSYAEFMLHSSEFMPGGSPTFDTKRSIDVLYDDLHVLFSEAARSFRSATLAEFHSEYARSARTGVA
jgi:hypothetical protein